MNNNLRKVMREKNLTVRALAAILGIAEPSLQNKLQGVSDWKLQEVMQIMSLFPEYTMAWLFKRDSKEETA